jgi:DNA-binding phage protein
MNRRYIVVDKLGHAIPYVNSIRKISRETGVSRKKIKRALIERITKNGK